MHLYESPLALVLELQVPQQCTLNTHDFYSIGIRFKHLEMLFVLVITVIIGVFEDLQNSLQFSGYEWFVAISPSQWMGYRRHHEFSTLKLGWL